MLSNSKTAQIILSWLLAISFIIGILILPQYVFAEDLDDEDPPQDLVLKGDGKCTACHDENSDNPILAIGKTKHGTVADHRTPTCTSCHGEGGSHEDSPDRALMPERTFGKKSLNPVEERNGSCLACHQGGKRMHWAGSLHANRDIACTACHQIHAEQDKVRNRITQAEICFDCHKELRTLINRPSRHPIREGKVICSDCHNPHGSAGPSNMVRDSVNETCYSCHMEKRGPFVYNHPPVQENCAICHNPHGTTAPNLLRSRSPSCVKSVMSPM